MRMIPGLAARTMVLAVLVLGSLVGRGPASAEVEPADGAASVAGDAVPGGSEVDSGADEPQEIPNPWLESRPETEAPPLSHVTITQCGDSWCLRYKVAAGDTLGRIASRLGVGQRDLVALNDIGNANRIVAGQWLHVPSPLDEEGDAKIRRVPDLLKTKPQRLALILPMQRWAREYRLDPDLLAAVAWVESRWQSNALSEKQAMGVGQLIPDTVAFVSEVLIKGKLDPWNPEQNIRMSAAFLRYLLDQTGQELDDALAAYYQGLGALRRDGHYPVTKPYIEKVRAARALFG
jgi:LysM repeat protein